LSLGLGIQARFRPEPGKMKPVLAAAMGERLPAKITQRRSKSHFNEVYYLGLGRNVHRLEAMMRQAPMDGLAMVDKASLIQAIHEASLASAGVRQLQRLNFTLSLIKWLSMEPVWRGVPAAPTDVIHVGRSME
jgi:asparagine synthase (glutamine-hydrolysing)